MLANQTHRSIYFSIQNYPWGGQRRCVLAIKGKTPGSILQDLSTVRALFGLLRPRGVQVVAAAVVLMVDELGQVPGALVVKLEG